MIGGPISKASLLELLQSIASAKDDASTLKRTLWDWFLEHGLGFDKRRELMFQRLQRTLTLEKFQSVYEMPKEEGFKRALKISSERARKIAAEASDVILRHLCPTDELYTETFKSRRGHPAADAKLDRQMRKMYAGGKRKGGKSFGAVALVFSKHLGKEVKAANVRDAILRANRRDQDARQRKARMDARLLEFKRKAEALVRDMEPPRKP